MLSRIIRKNNFTNFLRRGYHINVVEHFNNPRNVGSFSKNDPNVGTGLVGAPACIHEDTMIAVADGRRCMSIKELYLENKIIQVWSYNIKDKIYEIKNARVIKHHFKKQMKKIIFDDNSFLICTDDHKFLLKNNNYSEVKNIKKNESITSWKEFVEQCNDYNHKIKRIEDIEGDFDCYDLQVEENNNFAIITKETKNIHNGIIIKNCGDVLKLQIKVDPKTGEIIGSKFLAFGCLAGNVIIATPKGYIKIKSLSVGNIIYAWNGKDIVENKIEEINHKWVHYKDLLKLEFEGSCYFKFVCSKDHIWWLATDKPIEASDLKIGDELIHITENELRSRTNIGRTDWMRKLASETIKLTNKSGKIDRSKMPQHQKGKSMKHLSEKISIGMKKKWKDMEYVEKWRNGMKGAHNKRPTKLEISFIELFNKHNIDCRYVGNSEFWCSVKGKQGGINPDFKVNGQRKVIEVYTSKLPKFMMDRTGNDWVQKRKKQFEETGFKSLFLNINEDDDEIILKVQNFIHNGLKVTNIRKNLDKRHLRGLERDGEYIKLYDIRLQEGANVFFAGRIGTHNCGSAIASSSVVSEMVKGKKFDDVNITNKEIAAHLKLPPVKLHCSMLAEDAVKAAIEDYKRKKKN